MTLATIVQKLEQFAEDVVNDTIAEGGEIGAKLESIGKAAAAQALDAVEGGFEDLVGKLGQRATKLVTDLMADDSLSGLEKANLAVVQLTEQATSTGIALAAQDGTALIKNAYLAVKAKLAAL